MMLVNLTATAKPLGPGPNRRTKRQPKWLGKRFDRAQTQNDHFTMFFGFDVHLKFCGLDHHLLPT
jgi:hypothetical protein